MELKTITFPSDYFPAADLRVSNDTHYKFTCASCSTLVTIPFGWLLQLNIPAPSLTTEEIEAICNHFRVSATEPNEHFELVKCSRCEAAYIVRGHINETSQGAYRVTISGMAQVTD